jgi:hypothetical protein
MEERSMARNMNTCNIRTSTTRASPSLQTVFFPDLRATARHRFCEYMYILLYFVLCSTIPFLLYDIVWYRTQKLIGWKPLNKNLSIGPLNICWTRTMWQKDATIQMQGAGTLTAFPLCWMKKGTFIILLWQHFWSHINAMDLLKWFTCQYVNLI